MHARQADAPGEKKPPTQQPAHPAAPPRPARAHLLGRGRPLCQLLAQLGQLLADGGHALGARLLLGSCPLRGLTLLLLSTLPAGSQGGGGSVSAAAWHVSCSALLPAPVRGGVVGSWAAGTAKGGTASRWDRLGACWVAVLPFDMRGSPTGTEAIPTACRASLPFQLPALPPHASPAQHHPPFPRGRVPLASSPPGLCRCAPLLLLCRPLLLQLSLAPCCSLLPLCCFLGGDLLPATQAHPHSAAAARAGRAASPRPAATPCRHCHHLRLRSEQQSSTCPALLGLCGLCDATPVACPASCTHLLGLEMGCVPPRPRCACCGASCCLGVWGRLRAKGLRLRGSQDARESAAEHGLLSCVQFHGDASTSILCITCS